MNCIICFNDPKPSDEFEANGADVSEQIPAYKTGDDKADLITLMNRIFKVTFAKCGKMGK